MSRYLAIIMSMWYVPCAFLRKDPKLCTPPISRSSKRVSASGRKSGEKNSCRNVATVKLSPNTPLQRGIDQQTSKLLHYPPIELGSLSNISAEFSLANARQSGGPWELEIGTESRRWLFCGVEEAFSASLLHSFCFPEPFGDQGAILLPFFTDWERSISLP